MAKSPTDPVNASGPGKVGPNKITEKGSTTSPDKSTFETYKEQAPSATTPQATTSSEISPMDLASKSAITSTPTAQTLTTQARTAQDTLGEIEKNLKTPNLKLKKSQSDLLNTKLNNANDHLANANKTMGANVPDDQSVAKNASPATKFLSLVTDGQNKLVQAQQQLQGISQSGATIKPADMLLVQVKLSQAQQEVEYSSVLLSQVVNSIKQTLNIQL